MYCNHLLYPAISTLKSEGLQASELQATDKVLDKLMSLGRVEYLRALPVPEEHALNETNALLDDVNPDKEIWKKIVRKLDCSVLRWCNIPVLTFFKAIVRFNLDTAWTLRKKCWYASQIKDEYYEAVALEERYERYITKEEVELLDKVTCMQRILVDPFGFDVGETYRGEIY